MHHRSIFLVGAGLKWVNGPGSLVVVDRESAAVCKRAAELAQELPGVRICITAGKSPEFGVMMNLVMARCLIALQVPAERIVTLHQATRFNTRGETEAFAARWRNLDPESDTQEIYVVDRDFHMFRTSRLLDAQLDCYIRTVTTIIKERVASKERMKNFLREPLALAKDAPYILWRRFCRWYRYYLDF